jgi:hypothetical protein
MGVRAFFENNGCSEDEPSPDMTSISCTKKGATYEETHTQFVRQQKLKM